MSMCRHKITGEVREIDDAIILAWRDANNAKFAAWEPYTPPPPEPVPEPVPQQVTKRQWRLYCIFDRGIADPDALVHGAIDQYVPAEQRAYAHEDYRSTYYIDRTNPLVAALAPQLGITDLDEAFREMGKK